MIFKPRLPRRYETVFNRVNVAMGTTPGEPLYALGFVLEAFLGRVRREQLRLSGAPTPTERLGGVAALGQSLELLLRGVFGCFAAALAVSPEALFAEVTAGKFRWEQAGAGQLVWAIKACAGRLPCNDPLGRALVREIVEGDGLFDRLVRLRNDTLHGRATPERSTYEVLLDATARRLGPLAPPQP